jgi:IPT/TIG domain
VAGDFIGLDFSLGSQRSGISVTPLTNAEAIQWHPSLPDNGEERETGPIITNDRLDLSAEVVLTPALSSLSPVSGSTTGGNAVKIGGLNLDGATSVTFGSASASSFSVDSSNQITAIGPATGASTVDVRVTGPGGSSEPVSADKYTFTAPAACRWPLAAILPLVGSDTFRRTTVIGGLPGLDGHLNARALLTNRMGARSRMAGHTASVAAAIRGMSDAPGAVDSASSYRCLARRSLEGRAARKAAHRSLAGGAQVRPHSN